MTCYLSKVRMLGLFVLGLVMAGVGYFCTTLPDLIARLAGWAGVIFFGLGSLIAILPRLGKTSAQITIDAQGITHHRWSMGTIPWRDIEQVWISSVHSSRFLCVKLKEPTMYLNNLTAAQRALVKMNQGLGFGDLNFGFQGLKPGLDEVWEYILANHTDKALRQS